MFEREHQLAVSHTHLEWTWTSNLGMYPDPESNPQPFGRQDDTPTTELLG